MRRKHIIAAIIGASLLLLFLTLQGLLRGMVLGWQAEEAAAKMALAKVFIEDGLQMAIIGAALGVCIVMLWDGIRMAMTGLSNKNR
jgi:hypothetical protein